MKVQPVIYSKKPKYPDKYSLKSPYEIMAYKPKRWMNKPLTLAVLSACTAILFSSCTNASGISSNETNTSIPIFSHGEGTGVIGCMSVNAPIFLTEEEAYAVIFQELKNAGITVSKNDKDSSFVKVPITKTYYEPGMENDKIKTNLGNLNYDASTTINSKNINIEFVSLDDYRDWQDPNQGIYSSVESLNFKGTAEALAKENKSVAAFYDPFIQYEPVFQNNKEVLDNFNKAHDESIELLKLQVKDFIEWLKAEGVI